MDADASPSASPHAPPPHDASPRVAFLVSTFNRRDVLLQTLRALAGTTVPSQIFVVDNASTDGTADAVRAAFPAVHLLAQRENRGACAKNLALPLITAPFTVFLDDDSFPQPGSVEKMLAHFEADPSLGAAIFTITLPSGAQECSAYPDVFIGCGTGFRTDALRQVGGLPDDFFMQAEEYDLSLRLLDAGWKIRRFGDLHATHLKSPAARLPSRTMRLDVRNNLTLIGRYFPDEWVLPFARDWIARYRLIALANGATPAFYRGLVEGAARLIRAADRRPVKPQTFEQFARVTQIEQRLAQAVRDQALKRILLVDLGKNVTPYWRAAHRLGLRIQAIADARLGGRGFTWRGVDILPDADALDLPFDAAIISNSSPVHARQRSDAWQSLTGRPVVDLLQSPQSPT